MAINLRKFETESEFSSAYTGDTYVEPWVSYVEETSGIMFNKVYLKRIEIKNLKIVGDVPASGGTVNKDNCTYIVNAVYNDMRRVDITESAEVSGSLVIGASQIEHRHSAGTLTLTAEYSGLTGSADVKVYQEAFVPAVTGLSIDDLTWVTDIPASGGTATKDNCTYTVTAHYDVEGRTVDVTSAATVTGSLVVPESEVTERHSAGTLTLTAEYSGLTGSADVAVYQEESVSYLKFNILSGGVIAFGAVPRNDDGTATTLTIEYKKNDEEWTELTSTVFDTTISPETREDVVNSFSSKFSVDAGDVVMLRGNNQTYASMDGEGNMNGFNAFFSTASFNAEGNIMSLIDKNNFDSLSALTAPGTFANLFSGCYRLISAENLLLPAMTLTDGCYSGMFIDYVGGEFFDLDMGLTTAPALPATTLAIGCYAHMFGDCTSLTTAPSILPATTLASYCYDSMFMGCTSLTTAPELPATTLAQSCYGSMFQECTSLTQAPELPATTLASNCYETMFNSCTSLITAPALPATTLARECYSSMFGNCTSLTTVPELPATTLADSCYYFMFQGCTSLTTAPELPVTTLARYCYRDMFYGCTSLTTAPELPATILADSCYYEMFHSCTSLNYIKCLATDISASDCTSYWVSGVASSGTFVKAASMTGWSTGTSGIPNGWTVQDAS